MFATQLADLLDQYLPPWLALLLYFPLLLLVNLFFFSLPILGLYAITQLTLYGPKWFQSLLEILLIPFLPLVTLGALSGVGKGAGLVLAGVLAAWYLGRKG